MNPPLNKIRLTRLRRFLIISFFSVVLSLQVYAAGYLDMMRELDLRLICVVVWFAPPIVVLLFVLGGFLFSAGSPENRMTGKNLMMNALVGLLLVLAFLLISMLLVPKLDVGACFSGNGAVSVSPGTVQQDSGIIINAEGYFKKNEKTPV